MLDKTNVNKIVDILLSKFMMNGWRTYRRQKMWTGKKKRKKYFYFLSRKKYDRATVWQANERFTETLNRLRKTYTNSSNRIYAAFVVVVVFV